MTKDPALKAVTTDQEPQTDWKVQLSLKLGPGGQHLLNIRASSYLDLADQIEEMQAHPEPILDAVKLFTPATAPAPVPVQPPLGVGNPRPAPVSAPVPVTVDQGQEVGPFLLERLNQTSGTNSTTGKAWTKHQAVFQGGLKASTFDTLIAGVAVGLVGKPCYVKVRKTEKYGYELEGLRPA